jgi:hypothetical protein
MSNGKEWEFHGLLILSSHGSVSCISFDQLHFTIGEGTCQDLVAFTFYI